MVGFISQVLKVLRGLFRGRFSGHFEILNFLRKWMPGLLEAIGPVLKSLQISLPNL